MSDSKPNVTVTQTAGRDQIVAAAGVSNIVLAGDVAAFNSAIDQAGGSAEEELRKALKAAWTEIEKNVAKPDERTAVLAEFKKLADEALKAAKNSTVLKMAWGSVTAIVSGFKSFPALLKVGELLGLVPSGSGV